jgi:1-acyl-sn-glycerol-3-phosphate acyltransferase
VQKLSSVLRFAVGLPAMALGALVAAVFMLLLLPSRLARVRVGNYFGKTICRLMVALSGCPLTIRGQEHLDRHRPAIYVSNHTSIMDIFIAAWLSPVGTVGVAKKEVVYYPFFGQLYLLSGHLRIDRGNSAAARASLARLGETVRARRLSIFLWPEGTRSRDGHLQPFRKGLVHLAVQTGLPVVPFVVKGAQKAWVKHSLLLARVPIEVEVLPAIDTSNWDAEHADEEIEQVQAAFRAVLPLDQQPIERPSQPRQAASG